MRRKIKKISTFSTCVLLLAIALAIMITTTSVGLIPQSWDGDGNSASPAGGIAGDQLGTYNNADLVIVTGVAGGGPGGGIQRMVINWNTGNVGVGLAGNPAAPGTAVRKLHVDDSPALAPGVFAEVTRIGSIAPAVGTSNMAVGIGVYDDPSAWSPLVQGDPAIQGINQVVGEVGFQLFINPKGGTTILNNEGGNVGIGTSNPSNRLSVIGNADFTGKVGIGTTSPDNKLDVAGGVVVGSTYVAGSGIAPMDGMIIEGDVGIGDPNPANRLTVYGDSDFSGKVGIGLNNPIHKLEISDTSSTANNAGIYVAQSGAMTGNGYGIYVTKTGASTTNIAGYLSASGGTNNYGLIVASGDVGIGTTTPNNKLDVAGGVVVGSTFISGAAVAPTDGMIIEGDVGIGDPNPANRLTVYGDSDFSGKVGIGLNNPTHKLEISDTSGTPNNAGIYVAQTGAMTGTGYGIYATKTGASTTNIAGYLSASGGTNNYGLIVENGNVGIGTLTPLSTTKLHVENDDKYAGYFTTTKNGWDTHVIHAKFTGESDGSNPVAVYGYSNPADNEGIGGCFEGGRVGVKGISSNIDGTGLSTGVYGTTYFGTGTNIGVYGVGDGQSGATTYGVKAWGKGDDTNYGVYALADGAGTNFAIYGKATGGTANYAGYFVGAVTIDGNEHLWGDFYVGANKIIDYSGYIRPVSWGDPFAPNNSIYYSTTQSKLVYKDSTGTVNNLY